MNKLVKKERTIEAEFCKRAGEHTKEFAHYCGVKTWVKERHFKKALNKISSGVNKLMPREKELISEYLTPVHDMDGSYYTGSKNYETGDLGEMI
jgi:hypothetical protein